MINLAKEVAQTQALSQSAAANHIPTQPKPHSSSTDTVQISDAAKAAMHKATETHAETNIKAKCGDLEAQRLMELKAAKRKLLGLE
jgi:hypothetical protein